MKRGNTSRSQSRSRTVIRHQGNQVCRTRIPKSTHPVYVVKPVKKIYSRAKTAPSSHTISFNLPSSSNVRTYKKRITNKKVSKKKKPLKISSVKSRKSRNVSRCTSTAGLSKSRSSLKSYRYSEKNGSLAFFDIDTTCGKLFSSEGIQVDGPAFETCKTTVNFESDSPKTVGVVDVDKIRRSYGMIKAETTEKSTDPCFYNPCTEIFIEQQSRVNTPKLEQPKIETSEKPKQKTVVCKDKKTKPEPKKAIKEKPKYEHHDEHLKGQLVQPKPEKVRNEKPKSRKSASDTLKSLWSSLSSGSGASTSKKHSGREPISKLNPQYWSKEQQITAAALAIFAVLVAGLYYFETRE